MLSRTINVVTAARSVAGLATLAENLEYLAPFRARWWVGASPATAEAISRAGLQRLWRLVDIGWNRPAEVEIVSRNAILCEMAAAGFADEWVLFCDDTQSELRTKFTEFVPNLWNEQRHAAGMLGMRTGLGGVSEFAFRRWVIGTARFDPAAPDPVQAFFRQVSDGLREADRPQFVESRA